MTHWLIGQFDARISSYPSHIGEAAFLPKVIPVSKIIVRLSYSGRWYFSDGRACVDWNELLDARVVVADTSPWQMLKDYGLRDLVVVDPYLYEHPQFLQEDLRVDLSRFSSIAHAWKFNALRQWSHWNYSHTNVDAWFQSMGVRPWQEVRIPFDQRHGMHLDFKNAFGQIMMNELYPDPRSEWILGGQDHPCAMLHIQWCPTSSIGRFFHPLIFNTIKQKGYPAFNLDDSVECWIHIKEKSWFERHGRVKVIECRVPTEYGAHPMGSKVANWIQRGDKASPQERAWWKQRIAMAHTWTWSPKEYFVELDHEKVWSYFERLNTRPFADNHHTVQQWGHDLLVKGIDPLRSGFFMPIAWTYLHIRRLMTLLAEEVTQQGGDITCINIDGLYTTDIRHAPAYIEGYPIIHKFDYQQGVWWYPGMYKLVLADGSERRSQQYTEPTYMKHWSRLIDGPIRVDWRTDRTYFRRSNQLAHWQQAGSPAYSQLKGLQKKWYQQKF